MICCARREGALRRVFQLNNKIQVNLRARARAHAQERDRGQKIKCSCYAPAIVRSTQLEAEEETRFPFTRSRGSSTLHKPIRLRKLFLVDVAAGVFPLSELLNFPSRCETLLVRRSLSRHLRVCSFDSWNKLALHSAHWLHCSRCLHGPCSRIGRAYLSSRCGSRRFEGSRSVGSRDAVSQVSSSTAGRGTKKGPRVGERGEIWTRGRTRGRNSRTSFLDGWRPAGKTSDASRDDERKKECEREREQCET